MPFFQGGPNWSNNTVDAPVIVNEDADEFYKQPMFYALGHISRFLSAGSVRVAVQETVEGESGLEFAGVERQDGSIAITIMNRYVYVERHEGNRSL